MFRLCALALASVACATTVPLDFSVPGTSYEGVGALSGGGGVTRLLIDYEEALQQDILDILFKPKAGASLQIIKLEIGGDTASTEGTEMSHSRVRGDLNCTRGYEWTILAAAKKRNPGIRTYGLTWGVPGWIGDGNNTQNPGSFYSQDNIDYHLSWLDCALNTWGVEIDYLGIWNERSADSAWTIQLRQALDNAGYLQTRIVSADEGWEPTVGNMASSPELAAAVDVVGAHYPGAPPAAAWGLNKTLFASEMWNLGEVDDWHGAQVLMSDLVNHAQWGLSASILWCLIYSWLAPLPFSRVIPGTNAGAGHSILTAAEPWGGNYQINPQVHVMAHHTQFADPGWVNLPRGTPAMGPLPGGGALATRYNPRTPLGVLEFSVTLHTNGAALPQSVSFAPQGTGTSTPPPALHVWFTNETVQFVQLQDVPLVAGAYTLTLQPNAFYSLTTTTGQGAPAPVAPIPPSTPFPFPYADAFDSYRQGAIVRYFSDIGGVFEAQPVPAAFTGAAKGGALKQVITKVPIAWETNPEPYTLIGNFNEGGWTDYVASADMAIDPSAMPGPAPPPGSQQVAFMSTCAPSGSPGAQAFSQAGGAGTPIASAAFPGQCLGFTGGPPLYPGAQTVGLVPCSASSPAWTLSAATQQLQAAGQCLDVLSGNASAGVRVIAYECKQDGSSNQKWALAPLAGSGGSSFALTNALDTPPLCLDLEAGPPPPPAQLPYLQLAMRIAVYVRNGPPPSGYTLRVSASANATVGGAWQLQFAATVLSSGLTPQPVLPGVFYSAAVAAKGSVVTASWEGVQLAQVSDAAARSTYGMAAVGCGWHEAWFDNFAVAAV